MKDKDKKARWLANDLIKNQAQENVFLSIYKFSKVTSEEYDYPIEDFIHGAMMQVALLAWNHGQLDTLTKTWDEAWTAFDRHSDEYAGDTQGDRNGYH